MNPRERLTAALNLEPVDRRPWAPLIDNYTRRNYALEDQQQNMYTGYIHDELHCDVIERWAKPYTTVRVNTEEHVTTVGDNDMIITTLKTPIGVVEETIEKYASGGAFKRKKHFIECEKDYEVFACAYSDQRVIADYQNFEAADRLVGEKGVVIPPIPFSPLAYLYNLLMDVQQMIFDIFDRPKVVETFMQAIHKKNMEICQVAADSPAQYFISVENTSTTMLSEGMIRDYVFPFLNDYATILHKKGKKYIHHACGKLKSVLHLFAESKVDGIDSLTPPTIGDTEAWEAFEAIGDRIIIGGLPQDINLDERELRRQVVRLLERTERFKGLIVSGGNSPGAPIERYRCVGDILREHGR